MQPVFNPNTETSALTKTTEVDSQIPNDVTPQLASENRSGPRSWRSIVAYISTEWRPVISFTADVYLCKQETHDWFVQVLILPNTAYIFWSIFTSLVPTLFYFSVWELAIGGAELALLSTLSPILLAIPPVLWWVRTREGRTTLHALSFSGLTAYTLYKPMHRLMIVTFATSVLIIRQVIDWTGIDGHGVGCQGIGKWACSFYSACQYIYIQWWASDWSCRRFQNMLTTPITQVCSRVLAYYAFL
jgi:hypothetical protein